MAETNKMVVVENITHSYGRMSRKVLDNVGFTVEAGQCIAILGNNGAGKSTLIKCMDHIYPTQDGVVIVDGKNIFEMNGRTLAQHVAYVPQNAGTVNMTVFDAILLGRKPYIKWDDTEEDREIVRDIIGRMGLEDYVLRNVSQLSGGEAQRVMLARALAQKPKFLLLDEPTSNLDPYNQHEVLRTVKSIARELGICVAIVIHDLNLAIRYCDQFLFLKNAGVYSYGDIATVTQQAIRDVYGMEVEILEHRNQKVIVAI